CDTSANPSTDSVSGRKPKRRTLTPSVTPSRPASSCRPTAASTARSSITLKSAAEMAPASRRSRASRSSGGRRRLPTTSVCAVIIGPASVALLQYGDVLVVAAETPPGRSLGLDHDHQAVSRLQRAGQPSLHGLATCFRKEAQ